MYFLEYVVLYSWWIASAHTTYKFCNQIVNLLFGKKCPLNTFLMKLQVPISSIIKFELSAKKRNQNSTKLSVTNENQNITELQKYMYIYVETLRIRIFIRTKFLIRLILSIFSTESRNVEIKCKTLRFFLWSFWKFTIFSICMEWIEISCVYICTY